MRNTGHQQQLCAFCYLNNYLIITVDWDGDEKKSACTKEGHERRDRRPLRNLCKPHPTAAPGQQHGMSPGEGMRDWWNSLYQAQTHAAAQR